MAKNVKAVDTEWYKAQRCVRQWLRRKGITTKAMPYKSPFDLLVVPSGQRIEIKWAAYRHLHSGEWGWMFNFHRHGKLAEDEVDAYILRLQGERRLGLSYPLHLVIKAPVSVKTLSLTFRRLISRYSKNVSSVSALGMSDGAVLLDKQ